MERKQQQIIEAYERVQLFLDTHPLEGGASYGAPKVLLDDVVARLCSHAEGQESGTRQERAEVVLQRWSARQLRQQHLRPIAQVGRTVLSHVPEIDALLRLPSRDLPLRLLVLKAEVVQGLAARHEEILATSGCEAGFLARLEEAIEALKGTLVRRAMNTGIRVGCRKGLADEIKRGRDAVQMLDAIVHRRFRDRPDTLAAWRVAKRVRRVPGGRPAVVGDAPQDAVVPLKAA